MNRRLATPLIAFAATAGLTLGSACTTEEGSTPAPGDGETSETQKKEQQEPQGESERKDLVSFTLDDRSVSGLTDIWVTWEIKNNSSEKSDYTWDWEAVDSSGTRIANSTELVTSVQPGQVAKGESPTTLQKIEGVELNITSFDRTASLE